MNIKSPLLRSAARIAVILLAGSIVSAYVIYSQRRANRAFMHGTKSTQVLEDLALADSTNAFPRTGNQGLQRTKDNLILMGGSKSSGIFNENTVPISALTFKAPSAGAPAPLWTPYDSGEKKSEERMLTLSGTKALEPPQDSIKASSNPEDLRLPIMVGGSKSALIFSPPLVIPPPTTAIKDGSHQNNSPPELPPASRVINPLTSP